MKRKTRNFIEDTLIIIVVLAVIYLIYAYFFKENSNVEEANSSTKTEISINSLESLEKGRSFLENIYDEIKEILFEEDKNQYETNLSKEKEPQNDIHIQRAEDRFQSIIETSNTNNSLNNLEEQTKLNENEENSNDNSLNNLKEESKQEQIEDKTQEQQETNNITSEKETKDNILIKGKILSDTDKESTLEHKQEEVTTIKQEARENLSENSINDSKNKANEVLAKPFSEIKKDENRKNNIAIKNLDNFFQNLEKKISSNIKKNLDSSNFQEGEFVNIRVTILKSGKYEQLIFVSGNKKYFEQIENSIKQVFPLQIDTSLKRYFPRYYRLKIEF